MDCASTTSRCASLLALILAISGCSSSSQPTAAELREPVDQAHQLLASARAVRTRVARPILPAQPLVTPWLEAKPAAATNGLFSPLASPTHPALRPSPAIALDVEGGTLRPRFSKLATSTARLQLPTQADLPFELEDPASALAIRVTRGGATAAPAKVVDGYVVYPDPTGGAIHRPTPDGTEDFVYFETRPSVARLSYDVELTKGVFGLRLVAATLELLDEHGVPRLRMAPPYLIDRQGVRQRAGVSVTGCAADVDPRPPWGRPFTPPGASKCTVVVEWDDGVEYPALVDPAWTLTKSMAVPRADHTATLLASGRVLVAGGGASSAEVYDPATATWSTTGSPSAARSQHAAVLLPSGGVLVVGGSVSTAEIYNAATGTWTATGSASIGRTSAATALVGGKVVMAGGFGGPAYLSSAEQYDPGSGTWTALPAMPVPRMSQAAALTSSGKLLVVGGANASAILSSAVLYDPTTSSWATTSSMAKARFTPAASVLPSGQVLVSGYDSTAELFDPTTATWSPAGSMPFGLTYHTSSVLPSGHVVVVGSIDGGSGGSGAADSEIFDAAKGKWLGAGYLNEGRYSHSATVLATGKLLLAGGYVNDAFGSGGSTPTSSAELFATLPTGSSCSQNGECVSGVCADAVCCATACTGACNSCRTTGSVGTCVPIASGPPSPYRSCSPPFAAGTTCTAGVCTPCTSDAGCSTGNYCSSGDCVAKKPLGSACGANNQCQSNFCVDGYCCNTACSDQCAACDVPGKLGACSPIAGKPHGARPACTGIDPYSVCGSQCLTTDTTKCNYPGTTVTCSSDTCLAGVETHLSTCNGSGSCFDKPKPCAPYACGATGCKTSCTSASDCAAGATCASNVCAILSGPKLGDPCTDGAACPTGTFCTDGVCCKEAICGAGLSCSTAGKRGTCATANGIKCAADAECGSGFCTDGVCCDRRCDQQCEACDAVGRVGTCSPVAGAPHGALRPKCSVDADPCKSTVCDGKTAGSCAGKSGPEVSCGKNTCAGSTFTAAPACDGAGSCAAKTPIDCAKYVCEEGGCRSDCVTSVHCAKGFACVGGGCVPNSAKCSPDGLSSIPVEGTPTACAPYRCGSSGACRDSCTTTDDCVTGAICDLARSPGQCVPSAGGASTEDGGGCNVGHSEAGAPHALATLLVLAFGARRRRRARAGLAAGRVGSASGRRRSARR